MADARGERDWEGVRLGIAWLFDRPFVTGLARVTALELQFLLWVIPWPSLKQPPPLSPDAGQA